MQTYSCPKGSLLHLAGFPLRLSLRMLYSGIVMAAMLLTGSPAFSAAKPRLPSAPTGLTASATSTSQVQLRWTDKANNEDGYYVEFIKSSDATYGGSWSRIALPQGSTSYLVGGLSAGTGYSFRVLAYNYAGASSSPIVTATTYNTSTSSSCSYSISPTSASVSSGGGSGSVSVSTSSGCAWTASESLSWVSITAGTSGSGNGTVTYSVSANTSSSSRSGTLTVAGKSFTITQSGASSTSDTTAPTVSCTSPANYSTVSGTVTVSVSASDNAGVTKVELYRSTSILLGTDTSNPYSFSVVTTTLANGWQSFVAKAYDAAGNVATSSTLWLYVNNSTTDTTAPSVSLTSPSNGSTVSGTMSLAASASDNVGVTKVEFYRGTVLVGSDTSSPYSISFNTTTVANGSYSFLAKAYDSAGNVGTSSTVSVSVNNTVADTTAPTVSLTSPTAGATVSGTITLAASASDNVGVAKVEFYRDSAVLVGTDTTASFGVSFNTTTVSDGSHTFYARAYDAAGNVATCTTKTVTVQNTVSDTTAPVVSLTSPLSGSTVSGTITLSASASDDVGMSRVEFYRDSTTLLGTDTSSPYSLAHDTTQVTGGTHTYSAKAFDAAGNSSISSSTVTVKNSTAESTGFQWSSSFGGLNHDYGYAVGVDPRTSEVILAGSFSGPVDFGGGVLNYYTGNNILLAKYSESGQHVWSKGFAGPGSGKALAVAVDANGNVFVTGWFVSGVNFGGGTLTSAGGQDIFLAKYSSTGGHLWSKRFGSTDTLTSSESLECGWSLAVDSNGDVVLGGAFMGTVNFGGGSLTSTGDLGYLDAFLAKFSGASGTHVWSKRFGSSGQSEATTGVAVDGSGNILSTGRFQGAVDFGGGALTSAGGQDIFLAKYSSNGSHVWSKRFGGAVGDTGNAVAVDGNGNVALTGNFSGTVDFGGGALTSSGTQDMFLAKFSSTGGHLWSKRFGGSIQYDAGNGVAIDKSGNILATGYFYGTVDFGSGPVSSAGAWDIFVSKYSPTGVPIWSRAVGGSNIDEGNAIAVDAFGNSVITGRFFYTVDFGGGAMGSAGGADIFLVKYGP